MIFIISVVYNEYSAKANKTISLEQGKYYIECRGAQGGNSSSSIFGGKGTLVKANISIRKGSNIKILVGEQPNGQKGGFPDGGSSNNNLNLNSMGGGGSTSLIIDDNPIIVAAGGGGSVLYEKYNIGHNGSPGGDVNYTYTFTGTGHLQKLNLTLETLTNLTELENETGSSENLTGGGGGYKIGKGGFVILPSENYENYFVNMGSGGVSFINTSRVLSYEIFDGNSDFANSGNGSILIEPICFCPPDINDCSKAEFVYTLSDGTPLCGYPKTALFDDVLFSIHKLRKK